MKNIHLILAIGWLFVACTNHEDGKYSNDEKEETEKTPILETRSLANDTIMFPYSGCHIYAQTQIIHFYLGTTEDDFKKMCYKYSEVSSKPPYWSGYYIQYRYKENQNKDNWYYYNPDSIKCKTPCLILLETASDASLGRQFGVELKSSKFPYDPFQYRAKLVGASLDNNIHYETEWHEDGVYSFETLYRNSRGFLEPGNTPSEGVEYVDVSVRLTLYVELHLDARSSAGFTHILKLGDQRSPEFKVGSGEIKSFSYSFIVDKTMQRLPMNSFQEIRMPFEGSECGGIFYLNPDNFDRNIEINDFKDIYIERR